MYRSELVPRCVAKRQQAVVVAAAAILLSVAGCSPRSYRQDADSVAYELIEEQREQALGRSEPFSIERPADALRRRLLEVQGLPTATPISFGAENVEPIEQWPDDEYLDESEAVSGPSLDLDVEAGQPLQLTLVEALQVGARNSRDYQSQKESVFQSALSLDLQRDDFRGIWSLSADSELSRDLGLDPPESFLDTDGAAGVSRTLKNGVTFTLGIGLDLVNLLTQDKASARGVTADGSISIPLLRGASRFVVTEPLTQAQRSLVYSIYTFERFKRSFAVRIATDYLGVLEQLDRVKNAEDNYRSLIVSTRRARRLADSGRRPEEEVDRAEQDELRARNSWISSQQSYERTLDRFKTLLGLPADMQLSLDREELTQLENVVVLAAPEEDEEEGAAPGADEPIVLVGPTQEDAGPLELSEGDALSLAFENRLDLRTAIGRVDDAQRDVAISADSLRADMTLLGSASIGTGRSSGSVDSPDGELRADTGRYSALLGLDLPLERTAERNSYRNSLIEFERAVRDVQDLEDQIKLEVRDDLRTLLEARESLRIQQQAVAIAERRVASQDLLLRAGRTVIREFLDAQEDLVAAQNALTSARVQYRVSELELQRDLDVLEVNELGLWREYVPGGTE